MAGVARGAAGEAQVRLLAQQPLAPGTAGLARAALQGWVDTLRARAATGTDGAGSAVEMQLLLSKHVGCKQQ